MILLDLIEIDKFLYQRRQINYKKNKNIELSKLEYHLQNINETEKIIGERNKPGNFFCYKQ